MLNLLNKQVYLFFIALLIFMIGCSTSLQEDEFTDHLQLAESYQAEFDYDQALKHFFKAAELDPNNAALYYKIGRIYGIKHSREPANASIIGGRINQQSRVKRRKESNYHLAVKYLQKASDLGHINARQLLRAMYDNTQHLDVKY